MKTRRYLLLAGVLAGCIAVASLVTASVVGADSSDGAVSNQTPGATKLYYTGTTNPNTHWGLLGRLTLPVGSWAIVAKTNLFASGPATSAECWLMAPNARPDLGVTALAVSPKSNAIRNLSFSTVSNAPNGGHADLWCKLLNQASTKTVFARGTTITAVSVTGVTQTANAAPPLGSS